jgi:hypothetical protein
VNDHSLDVDLQVSWPRTPGDLSPCLTSGHTGEIEVPEGGAEGMLVIAGGRFGRSIFAREESRLYESRF